MNDQHASLDLTDTLNALAESYTLLGAELDRPATSTGGGGDKHRLPLNRQILQARLDIRNFAQTYAHMLVEARGWKPDSIEPPALIAGVINRIGFFTESADPHMAQDITEEADTLLTKARDIIIGEEVHKNRLARCREDGCGGSYTLTYREGAGTDDERMWRLRATARFVKCDRNPNHQIAIHRLAVEAS